MRHYRCCKVVMSSLLLTWCRDTCSWLWQKMTSRRTIRAGSSGLYEFTCMPFSLSNVVLSFCRLMEQCLSDQQFATLQLYLDGICVFASDVSNMLDQIELVFNWLTAFSLKQNVIFLSQHDLPASHLVN